MTASNPARDESSQRPGGPPPRGAHPEGHLDSTAQLMNRIAGQLGSQLSLVSLDGTRRPPPPALVLVAHGSRDPRALATVRSLMERVRELRPHLSVRLGHIELNEPRSATHSPPWPAGRTPSSYPCCSVAATTYGATSPRPRRPFPACAPASPIRSARTRCSWKRSTPVWSTPVGAPG